MTEMLLFKARLPCVAVYHLFHHSFCFNFVTVFCAFPQMESWQACKMIDLHSWGDRGSANLIFLLAER